MSEVSHTNEKEPVLEKEYEKVIEEIKELNWESLDGKELQQLMYLSYISAREFAEALRIALELYPDDEQLKEMARGELQTQNLKFEDPADGEVYNQQGDHADYLNHFLKKYHLEKGSKTLKEYADAYLEACRALEDKVRAMSVFSREEELSGIFREILKAKNWDDGALPAFKDYLEKHIDFDSKEGGHAELTKKFPVDDSVKLFYEARLKMYRAIPRLFEKEKTGN